MKKLNLMMIAMLLATVLVSCGAEENNEPEENTDEAISVSEATTDAYEAEIEEDEVEEIEEVDSEGNSEEWDEVLDDYEAYMEDYVAILKKQQDDPSDMSIMTESMELMETGTEWSTKMAEISDQFGPEQAARMLEIQTKLTNAAAGL